jgi:hypothetical protein
MTDPQHIQCKRMSLMWVITRRSTFILITRSESKHYIVENSLYMHACMHACFPLHIYHRTISVRNISHRLHHVIMCFVPQQHEMLVPYRPVWSSCAHSGRYIYIHIYVFVLKLVDRAVWVHTLCINVLIGALRSMQNQYT